MRCFSGSSRRGRANRGATLPVSMYYAVEWLGRGGDGNSSSSFCTWGRRAVTTAAVSELQGLIKGVVLALTLIRMTKDEKVLAIFKGLML